MKIKTELELNPFSVPNYVTVKMPPGNKQDGFREAPKFHLSELSEETLNALCEQFKKDVFEKAEKPKS